MRHKNMNMVRPGKRLHMNWILEINEVSSQLKVICVTKKELTKCILKIDVA